MYSQEGHEGWDEAIIFALVSIDDILRMKMERKDDRDAGRNRML